MNFEKLLSEGKIQKVEKTEADFSLSERDLSTAKRNFDSGDFDWAFNIAYNAVLQAGRTVMFCLGYKTSENEQHKSIFEFLENISQLSKKNIDFFDRIRKKRNNIIYRDAFVVSKKEVEEVLVKANEFVREIRTFVREIRTGEKK